MQCVLNAATTVPPFAPGEMSHASEQKEKPADTQRTPDMDEMGRSGGDGPCLRPMSPGSGV